MVTDETTKPGYVKLQYVWNKFKLYSRDTITDEHIETDNTGRLCLRHVVQKDGVLRNNGPARTYKGEEEFTGYDEVLAYRCQHIPSFAKSWLRRVISCNRLNNTHIKTLIESGCFFVWKNHPSSHNGPIELRLSFSLQERELVSSLNSTQHKCYILLKIIKKDIILKRVPESISSYHCKTCLLYAVEKTPCGYWTCRNLLECTLMCIKLLLHWVKEQYCPNYFIPDENMFDKLECIILRRVQTVLEDMTHHWCTFLWSLACDDIGNVLHDVLFGCGPSIIGEKNFNVSKQTLIMKTNLNNMLRHSISLSLKECKGILDIPLMSILHSMQTHLLHTGCEIYHTEHETTLAIRIFLPHIRLKIAQCVACITLTTNDADLLKMLFDTFTYYIEESKDCDVISAYLIVASYCLQSYRYAACEGILLKCETALKSHVISACGCTINQSLYRNEACNELVRMHSSKDILNSEFATTCTAGCLTFLPHQANIVPPALHCEMYRSVRTPPGSRDEKGDYWFDWMVVDSKVYLYFLQYILYSKSNKPVYKQDAVDNLIHVIITDANLGHRETAYNLLGWIFKQENKTKEAMEYFLKSWRIRPIHNAAKWHVLDMIHSITRLNADIL